jgi:hypothetical protein
MESPFDPQENPSDSLFEGCALGKVALDGTATNCVTTRTSGSCLGGTGDQHKSLKSFERHKRRL